MARNVKYTVGIWILRAVLTVLIIFWMSIIFGLSSDDGTESQSLSDKITIQVVQIIKPDYDTLSTKEQQQFFENVSFVVRKMGHFGEYAILGMLLGSFFITFDKIRFFSRGRTLTISITTILCMIYAATDEFHQGFVDGRSPKVMDVGIDTMGGLAGAVFLILIWWIIAGRKKSHRKKTANGA